MDQVMEMLGIPVDGRYLGFSLRNWKGLEAVSDEIARAAEYAYQTHGLTPCLYQLSFRATLRRL